jgi:hypothetical protein
MGEFLDQVPEAVRDHLRGIARTSGLPAGEESLENLAKGWIDKMDFFQNYIDEFAMEETEEFERDSPRGGLLLTYSGSIITLGPLTGEARSAEYTSIGLRSDVPDSASKEDSRLEADVELDAPAVFLTGPIQKSSAIYKIAVYREEMAPEEEAERLAEATQILTDGFIEVNKTLIVE